MANIEHIFKQLRHAGAISEEGKRMAPTEKKAKEDSIDKGVSGNEDAEEDSIGKEFSGKEECPGKKREEDSRDTTGHHFQGQGSLGKFKGGCRRAVDD